jgi:hypothetical protein
MSGFNLATTEAERDIGVKVLKSLRPQVALRHKIIAGFDDFNFSTWFTLVGDNPAPSMAVLRIVRGLI